MRVIYKYKLDEGLSKIAMQKGAIILHVAIQKGYPYVWALVDPEAEMVYRIFSTLPTGLIVDNDVKHLTYINTIHTDEGLVWHIFDIGEVAG